MQALFRSGKKWLHYILGVQKRATSFHHANETDMTLLTTREVNIVQDLGRKAAE